MVSYVLCLSVWLNTISSRPIHVAVNGHLCSFCGWVMFHCVCVYTPHRLYWWGGVFPGVAGFNREPWGCKPWPQSGAFQCGPPGRGGGVGGCVEGEPWLNSSEAQPVLAGCSEATLDFGSERGVWYPCRKTSLNPPATLIKSICEWHSLSVASSILLFPLLLLLSLPPLSSSFTV